jgi:hypothetical protein
MRRQLTIEERLGNTLRQMAPGTLGGRVKSAMPVSAPLAALETTRPRATGGGGKEYATVYVAASDSHPDAIATADLVCDGIDDGVTIDDAAATAAAFGGGRVILAEGTYRFGPPTYTHVTPRDGVVLQGQGPGTVLQFAEDNVGFFAFGFVSDVRFSVRDIQFSAGGFNNGHEYLYVNGSNNDVEVLDCVFSDMVASDTGVYYSAGSSDGRCLVAGCRFLARAAAASATTISGNDTTVRGCYCEGDVRGPAVVVDCVVRNNAFILGGLYVNGNIVEGGGAIRTDGDSIVANNVVIGPAGQPGIAVRRGAVVGNVVASGGNEGIWVFTSSGEIGDILVAANLVHQCGQAADNTYAGIRIGDAGFSATNRCSVQGNTVRHGGGAVQHRYGIRVENGTDNFITNNDLKDSGRTASFSDAATGTVTAAGNRA